ncbi:helix-turn-helix transcriptional regulator [Streptomyces ipomoeae]|nr:helix-turn-helix transcriptional regulator [Streptomyces ipomoeae]MDX2820758.1 helix-turn-helix transcriptional regulator [Streptomyces ipomoeae]
MAADLATGRAEPHPRFRLDRAGQDAAVAEHPEPAAHSQDSDDKALERVIVIRAREYRQAARVSVGEMAQRVGISKAMLSKIENAQTACGLTTLSRRARGLGVPVTALFRGMDDEREAVFVPAGHGARIVRRGTRVGHEYAQLGSLRGAHKRMDALQFDGEAPHGPERLVELPIRFLTVTAFGDTPHH